MSATLFSPRQLDECVTFQDQPAARQRRVSATMPSATDENMHPAAIAIALGGFSLFLAASWVGWAFGYMALLMAVICILSIMYFTPMVLGGVSSAEFRGDVTRRTFAEFLTSKVQIFTGPISGWAAMTQIVLMPIALGILMCLFAALWLSIR
jgi:uncharacterized membrane protein YgcG